MRLETIGKTERNAPADSLASLTDIIAGSAFVPTVMKTTTEGNRLV